MHLFTSVYMRLWPTFIFVCCLYPKLYILELLYLFSVHLYCILQKLMN